MTWSAPIDTLILRAVSAAVVFLGIGSGFSAAAQEAPSVDEIVHHANLVTYFQGRDGRAQVAMTIADKQGRKRERQLTMLRRDASQTDALAGGAYRSEQKYYVYFHRPADVNKLAFLVWKHLDRDDDRWLYLPALDLVKRIAASDKRTSFAGSISFMRTYPGVSTSMSISDERDSKLLRAMHTPKDPVPLSSSLRHTFARRRPACPRGILRPEAVPSCYDA